MNFMFAVDAEDMSETVALLLTAGVCLSARPYARLVRETARGSLLALKSAF